MALPIQPAEKGRVAQLSPVMLNQVLESTLAFMVALLVLSISAIARVRPTPSSTSMNSEQSIAGDPTMNGNGIGPATFSPAGAGPALWSASPPPPGNVLATNPGPRRAGMLGRRYEARHVRGRMPVPRQPGPAGPPWGPAAPPPAGRPQAGSERWT
jgi:hypothetical protein